MKCKHDTKLMDEKGKCKACKLYLAVMNLRKTTINIGKVMTDAQVHTYRANLSAYATLTGKYIKASKYDTNYNPPAIKAETANSTNYKSEKSETTKSENPNSTNYNSTKLIYSFSYINNNLHIRRVDTDKICFTFNLCTGIISVFNPKPIYIDASNHIYALSALIANANSIYNDLQPAINKLYESITALTAKQ